jgi:outer membrane receptor protein involved in Fe transport
VVLACLGSGTSVGISSVDTVGVSEFVCYGRKNVRDVSFLLILSLLCLAPATAQSPNATINGIVLDPSGAAIAGAQIIVVNDATSVQHEAATNSAGIYVVTNLPPGEYRIQVAKIGFKTLIKPDLVLNVQDALAINFTLPIGAVSEIVTVMGGAPLVNTQDAAVSTVVDRQFAENLPLNGRGFQALIQLTPGVVLTPSTANDGGQFSVNGQRPDGNSFTVDGVSANIGATASGNPGPQTSGNLPGFTALGTTQSLVSVDALQEFKVQTSTYSAEYGRQPGGQISIVTRSGTNQFHGSLFDYLRNDVFDANDWFSDRAGQPKPPERQNDFGGTLGVPIVIPGLYNGHDRTFFFFSYEGLRLRLPQFNVTNVPTLAFRQQAPAGMQPILNAFPLPNGKDLGNGLAEFQAGYSNPSSLDATSLRVDHRVNSKVTLFGRYNNAPSVSVTRNAGSNLSTVQSTHADIQTVTLGATALLTSQISDELRVNYSHNRATSGVEQDNFGGATPPPRAALILPQFDSRSAQFGTFFLLPGQTSTGLPGINLFNTFDGSQRQVNIVDSISFAVGQHQLKFGVDYRRLTPILAANSYALQLVFTSQQQVLNSSAGFGTVLASGPAHPIYQNFSAYIQDNWKLLRRLTFNLGLRWDVNPAPSEANGNDPLALSEVSNLSTTQIAARGAALWKTTYNNFAPRVGAAYQLRQTQGHETVIRGGFGIFYDAGNDQGSLPFGFFPFSGRQSISNVTLPLSPTQVTPPVIPASLSRLTPPYGQMFAFDPALRLPYTMQWNLALERSLGSNQALTVSYVGAAGRRLLQVAAINLSSINANFTTVRLTRNMATSDYDSLQVQFQRRLSQGLQALGSYTWAHALDDDSSDNTLRRAQRGNAAFDIRNNLAVALTYDIPKPRVWPAMNVIFAHWAVDTSIHAQSALPVDLVARTATDPTDGSLINVRPDVVPGVPFYVDDPTVPGGRRINRAAFSIQPADQSGNFGRNQLRGLGSWQQDLALRRDFPLYENLRLQFRVEAFNIFNHPNFGTIQTTLTAANFGQPTNMLNRQLGGLNQLYQIGGPRSLQFAMKLVF